MLNVTQVYETYGDRTGQDRKGLVTARADDAQAEFADRTRLARSPVQPPLSHHAAAGDTMVAEIVRLHMAAELNKELKELLVDAWAASNCTKPTAAARDKLVAEVFTHWALDDLNSSDRDQREAALKPSADRSKRLAVVPHLDMGSQVVTPNGPGTLLKMHVGNWSNVIVAVGEVAQVAESMPWEALELMAGQDYCPDVLLPAGELNRDRGAAVIVYQRCLAVSGGDKVASTSAAVAITKAATKWRRQLWSFVRGSLEGTVTVGGSTWTIARQVTLSSVSDIGGVVLSCGTLQMPILQSSLTKLRALYGPHDVSGTRWIDNAWSCAHEPAEEQEFLQRVLAMLLRYHALSGAGADCDRTSGLHASVHLDYAKALATEFGVSMDAFANPLNTTQPRFCSLFPDVDWCFGSAGSFFALPTTLPPTESLAMHVNPPFDTHSIVRTVNTMLVMLRASPTTSRTFVMVIPEWTGTKLDGAIAEARTAPECTAHRMLSPANAAYVDGHQHRLARPYFRLESKTLLMVLQSPKAQETCHAGKPRDGCDVSRLDVVTAAWATASRQSLGLADNSRFAKRPRD
jgi:hypothetical protein